MLDLRELSIDLSYQCGKLGSQMLHPPCIFHQSTMQRLHHTTRVSQYRRLDRPPVTFYALRVYAGNRIEEVLLVVNRTMRVRLQVVPMLVYRGRPATRRSIFRSLARRTA